MGVVKHSVRVVSDSGFAVPVRRQPPLAVGYEHFRLDRQGQLLSPIAIVGSAIVGWIWLYLANSSIGLTASHLLVTDWRGSTTVIALGDVSRLVRIGVMPFEGPARQVVIGVDAAERRLFAVGAAYDAAAIAGSLSVPLSGSYEDVLTLREINRMYPGTVSGWGAHPAQLAIIAFGATVIVGIVAFIVITNIHG